MGRRKNPARAAKKSIIENEDSNRFYIDKLFMNSWIEQAFYHNLNELDKTSKRVGSMSMLNFCALNLEKIICFDD